MIVIEDYNDPRFESRADGQEASDSIQEGVQMTRFSEDLRKAIAEVILEDVRVDSRDEMRLVERAADTIASYIETLECKNKYLEAKLDRHDAADCNRQQAY